MSNEKKLQIVLGGTSGMGLATAIALGKQGPVLVGGRNEERLAKAVRGPEESAEKDQIEHPEEQQCHPEKKRICIHQCILTVECCI